VLQRAVALVDVAQGRKSELPSNEADEDRGEVDALVQADAGGADELGGWGMVGVYTKALALDPNGIDIRQQLFELGRSRTRLNGPQRLR
jgi:hypothetical protein